MPRAVTRGAAALFLFIFAAGGATAQTTPPQPELQADNPATFDLATGEFVATGDARLKYGDTLLLADRLGYNREKNTATARGHFSITSPKGRLLADSGAYDFATRALTLADMRAGDPPLYLSAGSAAGTADLLTLTDATVVYGEPGAFAPTLRADTLVYERGRRLSGRNVRLGIGDFSFFPLPKFSQSINEPLISFGRVRTGFRRSLGARAEVGLHLPVWPGWQLGGDLGIYTARGIMLGPSGEYAWNAGSGEAAGSFRSGFIRDHGDRLTDLLGRPVPPDRGFFEWRHQQRLGERLTLAGQFSWWEDSEIMRDFYPQDFTRIQQPDSWIEAVYAGDDYALSLFSRLQPNHYHPVQERLPEIRFDLLPVPIGLGFYERFNAGFAALREDDVLAVAPPLRSDRFDAYYALYRPIAPRDWVSFTPVAGGRVTHYAKTLPGSGRSSYTRWLGEVGFDAELRASGVMDYRNALWQIDGLRHLVTPRISYRYIPEAERGAGAIPPIDRRVFSTSLEPLGLGATRNIDDLHRTDTLRVGLDNVLQTRGAAYGSRDLFALDLAADLNLDRRPGEPRWGDAYAALQTAPAPWLRFDLLQRFSSRTFALREIGGAIELADREWWTLRGSASFLQHEIEQYYLEGEVRLNEVWRASTRLRYDARQNRWNEQLYGLVQNLGNAWRVRYEVSWKEGSKRESPFGFNIEVDLIRF